MPQSAVTQSGPLQSQQHTLMHVECPACEAATRAAVGREQFGPVLFGAAWPDWLGGRRKISAGTRRSYVEYFRALDKFFSILWLEEIRIGHVLEYQAQRRREIQTLRAERGWASSETDGASRINHEVSALGQVLARAGLWEPIKRLYEPLPLAREGPGIALTEAEERHLFEVARSRPRWLVAYCCHLISIGTTAGPGEIRHLQLRQIDLERGTIQVRGGAKNEFRVRTLPVEGDAAWAVECLVQRYERAMRKAGIAASPDHYVLYHRAHTRGALPDPTRPMGSWKRAHYSLRAQAGKKYPRLLTVRRYDLRHTAATKLLEDPEVSYSTIEKLMGHRIGSRTKRVYDHVRDATLRSAAGALDGGHTAAEARPDPRPEQSLRRPPRKDLNLLRQLLLKIS